MLDTNKLLEERGKTHGDYAVQATVAQALKNTMRRAPKWAALTDAMRDALEMDAVKTSRILCGNAYEPDHWDDKAGYAKLISNELHKEQS